MTIHQLRVLVTVGKLRSFTRASRSLDVSQPSVTLLIQNLQRELGTDLFNRLGNKIRPTRAGEIVLVQAKGLLAKVDQLKERIDEITGKKKGRLMIGSTFLPSISFLPSAVDKFIKAYPRIEVLFEIGVRSTIVKALLDGELDIGVITRAPQVPLLITKPYRVEEIVVIAPPNHPLTKKRSVPLKLLGKEKFIVVKKGQGQIRDSVEKLFIKKGIPFNVALEISSNFGSRDVIRTAVANNLGIGFGYKNNTKIYVKAGLVKVLKVPELKLKQKIYIVAHKNRQRLPLVKAFSAHLRDPKK